MATIAALVTGLFSAGGSAGAAAAGTGLSLGQTLGLVGTGISTVGTIAGGIEARNQAKYQQEVAEQNADEAKAASQREAADRRREGRLVMSRQRAAIAAGGGSTADDSVLDLMGDTAAAADTNAKLELYKGEQQARGYKDAANVAEYQAKIAMPAAFLGAAGDLFSGVSSMYSRFGQQQKRVAPASNVVLPYG